MTGDQRMFDLLRRAVPKMDGGAEPSRDLWPQMLGKMAERTGAPWLDWALGGGILAIVALCPSAVPVLLYCL